ncbi:serine/threonine-protein phosphatase, partial [Vibrio parahaemolyticus]|nr:serine/threonine-protein phosphatase [Vibrio parahaemolyticus]
MEDLLIKRLNQPINGNRSAAAFEARAVFATTVGLVRKENEDRAIIARFYSYKLKSFIHCYVLSDGMGGMANGGLAASITVATFLTKLEETFDSSDSIEAAIRNATEEAHKNVCGELNCKGGATLSAIISHTPGELYIVNIGDSRIYQCSSSNEMWQVTEDDDIKSFLKKYKGIEVNDVLAQRNGLTKFIGMEGDLDFEVEFCSSTSDFFIISDGIGLIGKDNLEGLYENRTSDAEFLQRCIHLSNWLGGRDNATGIYASLSKLELSNYIESSNKDYVELWDFHGALLFPRRHIEKPIEEQQQEKSLPEKKPAKKRSRKKPTSSAKSIIDGDDVEIESVQSPLFSNEELQPQDSEHAHPKEQEQEQEQEPSMIEV